LTSFFALTANSGTATVPSFIVKVADTKKRTADISAAKKQAKQHDQVNQFDGNFVEYCCL
jgi:membrane carboxypeptidase/penicillin-binding protein